jgi:hypothetical protein
MILLRAASNTKRSESGALRGETEAPLPEVGSSKCKVDHPVLISSSKRSKMIKSLVEREEKAQREKVITRKVRKKMPKKHGKKEAGLEKGI